MCGLSGPSAFTVADLRGIEYSARRGQKSGRQRDGTPKLKLCDFAHKLAKRIHFGYWITARRCAPEARMARRFSDLRRHGASPASLTAAWQGDWLLGVPRLARGASSAISDDTNHAAIVWRFRMCLRGCAIHKLIATEPAVGQSV